MLRVASWQQPGQHQIGDALGYRVKVGRCVVGQAQQKTQLGLVQRVMLGHRPQVELQQDRIDRLGQARCDPALNDLGSLMRCIARCPPDRPQIGRLA